ncbi:MAG: hypothetical protein NT150_02195 [Bacteroidetes bacterium]|nr:hypothetical protein [Bacteroidota bacterium]
MIYYDFNQDEGVLLVLMEGDITTDDILRNMDFISEAAGIPRNLKLVTDFRNADFVSPASEIEVLLKYSVEKSKNFTFIREAFIAGTPKSTALAMIYAKETNQSSSYKFKVFSSLQSALIWMKDVDLVTLQEASFN